MAITITNGTPVGASGGSNVTSISVSRPTTTTNDVHVIAVGINATGASVATPTGYTLLNGITLSSTSSSGLQVFYRKGAGASATVTLTSANAGRISAVPVLFSGVDQTTTIEVNGSAESLVSPTLTATNGRLLVTTYAVREATSAGGFTITQAAGMTEAGEAVSSLSNGTTQIGVEVSHLAVTAGATGTKTATTTANTTHLDGTINFILVPAAVLTVPDQPTLSGTAGSNQVAFTWPDPADNGSAVTDFHLERKTGTGGTYAEIGAATITAASNSYTDSTAVNGTTYVYRLNAQNANGLSAWSSEVTATPGAAASGFTAVIQGLSGGGPEHYYPFDTVNTYNDIGKATTKRHATLAQGTVTFDSTTVNGTSINSARFPGNAALSIPDSIDFSVTKTEQITIMVFLTIDDYNTFGDGSYTHYMGKGQAAGEFEWQARFYQSDDGGRPRRHSGYYYNPDPATTGGLGSGAYSQPSPVGSDGGFNLNGTFDSSYAAVGVEHVVFLQFNTDGSFGSATAGGIKVWWFNYATQTQNMNGTANIVPQHTAGAVRVGETNHGSFKGRIRRLAFWNRLLTQTEINTLVTNRALAEGSSGPPPVVAPDPPTNVQATRSSIDDSVVDVSWTAPADNGGASITKYTASFSGGGITGSVDTPNGTTTTAQLTGVPNVTTTVSVVAVNSAGSSTAATRQVAASTTLPLIGSLSDNFNSASSGLTWIYDQGVQENATSGQLEWTTIDATHRAVRYRGDFRSQSAFFQMTPSTASNTITSFFVRSTADRTKILRIAYLNPNATGGTIRAHIIDGAADPAPFSRVYNPLSDVYWRILDTGTSISFQVSANGVTWSDLRTGVARPTWLGDVEVGIETYTGTVV